jgi:hypothetical protein
MSEKRIISVASYKRINSLVKTIESIYNQSDEINIFLNDHEGEIPPQFLDKKINLYFSDNRYGDALKFAKLMDSDGYYLTIDDDLIYPPNYVDHMINRCKEFLNKRVITLHGRKFSKEPIKSFYNSYIEFYHCLSHQKKDAFIHFGGTGVMCFHTSLIKIPITYFEHPNMADVWVGKYCFENNIEVLSIAHSKDFLIYQPQKTTIFNSYSNSDTIQTKIVNDLFNSKIVETKIEDQEVVKKNTLKTLELTQKQINYNKINSIFQKSNPKTITQAKNNQEVVNIKLNSATISKLMGKGNKKFKK